MVASDCQNVVLKKELQVPLHLSHRLDHLRAGFALRSRIRAVGNSCRGKEFLHRGANSCAPVGVVDLLHGGKNSRSIRQQCGGWWLVCDQRSHLLRVVGDQL